MNLLGPRFYFRTTGTGILHCQRCGGDRGYQQCLGRRWVHVLFIPVIPLDRIREHVQCMTCHTRYRLEVLSMPTAAQMQAALPAGTLAAVTTMLQAGDPGNGPARHRAIEAVRVAGLDGYDDVALSVDLLRAPENGHDLAAALSTLALQLQRPAAEWFLADMVRIGLADGELTDQERGAAAQIAAQLGMTAAHAHGVIWMTEEGAAAG